jgi:hypothetical protein
MNILVGKSQAKRPFVDLSVNGPYNKKILRMEAELTGSGLVPIAEVKILLNFPTTNKFLFYVYKRFIITFKLSEGFSN